MSVKVKNTYALTGSYGTAEYTGCVSAFFIILCVSYNRNIPNSTRPPYRLTEYRPAPRAVLAGRNMLPVKQIVNFNEFSHIYFISEEVLQAIFSSVWHIHFKNSDTLNIYPYFQCSIVSRKLHDTLAIRKCFIHKIFEYQEKKPQPGLIQ